MSVLPTHSTMLVAFFKCYIGPFACMLPTSFHWKNSAFKPAFSNSTLCLDLSCPIRLTVSVFLRVILHRKMGVADTVPNKNSVNFESQCVSSTSLNPVWFLNDQASFALSSFYYSHSLLTKLILNSARQAPLYKHISPLSTVLLGTLPNLGYPWTHRTQSSYFWLIRLRWTQQWQIRVAESES